MAQTPSVARTGAPKPKPKPAPPRRRRTLLALLVLAAAALLGAGWALWHDDAALRWLLRQGGLEVGGSVGRADGGPFQAERVQWQRGGTRVTVHGLAWRDLRWSWNPYPGAWLRVEVDAPSARRVEVSTTPSPQTAPRTVPADLRVPLELVVTDLHVETVQIDAQAPLVDLRAKALHVGDDVGGTHRVDGLALRRGAVQLHDARLALSTTGSMPLVGAAQLAGADDAPQPWQARLRAGGTLARIALDANLAAAGAEASARAAVTPFAAWPLAALQGRVQGLDLSALDAAWPQTRLDGQAMLADSAAGQPLHVELAMTNALPGRWDVRRVPLRTLTVALRGRADDRRTLEFSALEATLGGERPAGRLTGSGRWQADTLQVEATLSALQPAQLDRRAPAMTLDGPLTLSLSGLPAPDGTPAAAALDGNIQARLQGRLPRRGTPAVQARLDGRFTRAADGTLVVAVPALQLGAGAARAEAQAELSRDATQTWRLQSTGTLSRFDPSLWWTGDALARGDHALNGRWQAQLTTDRPASLVSLRGQARLQLQRSRLAGVPLGADLALRSRREGLGIEGWLQAAANRVEAEGLLATAAGGDRWHVQVQAPALAALAPLLEPWPTLRPYAPRAGTLQARVRVNGRWPALATEGELQAGGLASEALKAGRVQARWSLAGPRAADAPLSLDVDATALALGVQRLDRLQAQGEGTWRAHRLQVQASSPLRPPAWTDALIGGSGAQPGTTLQVRAQGGWQPARDGSGRWSGTLQRLEVRARDRAATPWVLASGVQGEVVLDADGRPRSARAAPGSVQLLDAALRWREASWQAAGPMVIDAELEPLRVAPWLARVQPHFGWGGDLAVGGRLQLRRGERFDADLVLERAGGDLTVTDDGGTQALGLTDLRLALNAHDGVWHFTQALAGANVGVLGGAQSLRLPPQAAWPPPQTPLEGVVELRVANLGVWAPWLPPGWRLDGRLRTSAALGGRFGAPEYTGEIVGSGLGVRNLLEGVDVRDGELAVSLRGEDARIERFVLRGGDGMLRLAGGARFGAEPQAQLRLAAERFQALGRVDRRVVVSGGADLVLDRERLRLDGRLAVDEGLIDVSQAGAPTLDDDVVVVNRPRPPAAPGAPAATPVVGPPLPTAAPAPRRDVQVSVVVELGDKLRLRGRGLDATLRGELRITTPGGRLAVNGTVRADNGTYTAYGQNLLIERGVLEFSGEVGNPRLDILAVRPDVDIRIGVAVSGNAVNPRVRLYSEPEMSEIDKLSWLVMGRASEGLGRADTALLQRAALALLAGERGKPGEGVLKSLGLDELSVRQSDTGNVRDTVITVGKQLTQRWYVGYERGVNTATGTWQLIYRAAQRFTLRAQGGAENSLDVIWTWRWD